MPCKEFFGIAGAIDADPIGDRSAGQAWPLWLPRDRPGHVVHAQEMRLRPFRCITVYCCSFRTFGM